MRHIEPHFTGSQLRQADKLAGSLTLQPMAHSHRQALASAPERRVRRDRTSGKGWVPVALCVALWAAVGVLLALGV